MFTYFVSPDKAKKIPPRNIDPELEPYMRSFLEDARKRGVIITDDTIHMLREFIFVDNLSSSPEGIVMGVCTRYYSYESTMEGRKKVRWFNIEVLRSEIYDKTPASQAFFKEVLYHELFHCFLNKTHLPEGVPGIMAPVLSRGNLRAMNDWERLVDELFSPENMEMIPDAN